MWKATRCSKGGNFVCLFVEGEPFWAGVKASDLSALAPLCRWERWSYKAAGLLSLQVNAGKPLTQVLELQIGITWEILKYRCLRFHPWLTGIRILRLRALGWYFLCQVAPGDFGVVRVESCWPPALAADQGMGEREQLESVETGRESWAEDYSRGESGCEWILCTQRQPQKWL